MTSTLAQVDQIKTDAEKLNPLKDVKRGNKFDGPMSHTADYEVKVLNELHTMFGLDETKFPKFNGKDGFTPKEIGTIREIQKQLNARTDKEEEKLNPDGDLRSRTKARIVGFLSDEHDKIKNEALAAETSAHSIDRAKLEAETAAHKVTLGKLDTTQRELTTKNVLLAGAEDALVKLTIADNATKQQLADKTTAFNKTEDQLKNETAAHKATQESQKFDREFQNVRPFADIDPKKLNWDNVKAAGASEVAIKNGAKITPLTLNKSETEELIKGAAPIVALAMALEEAKQLPSNKKIKVDEKTLIKKAQGELEGKSPSEIIEFTSKKLEAINAQTKYQNALLQDGGANNNARAELLAKSVDHDGRFEKILNKFSRNEYDVKGELPIEKKGSVAILNDVGSGTKSVAAATSDKVGEALAASTGLLSQAGRRLLSFGRGGDSAPKVKEHAETPTVEAKHEEKKVAKLPAAPKPQSYELEGWGKVKLTEAAHTNAEAILASLKDVDIRFAADKTKDNNGAAFSFNVNGEKKVKVIPVSDLSDQRKVDSLVNELQGYKQASVL